MHATKLDVPYLGKVVIIHNGDWSGDAYIRWDWTAITGYPSGPQQALREVKVPGQILLALVKAQTTAVAEMLQDALRELGAMPQKAPF